MVFSEGCSMASIARECGVTRPAIHRAVVTALDAVRAQWAGAS
jgi:hypothetical protein